MSKLIEIVSGVAGVFVGMVLELAALALMLLAACAVMGLPILAAIYIGQWLKH
jgi:hypothetical protein